MKKILIIEDNFAVRENTAEIIALSNYEVLTAENGRLGVEVALREIPDLIICDIMMPVLDGYGVYHLLSKHAETASIPFIFLTAKSEKVDFRKGMEMGADDYITKPFDEIELLKAIEVRLHKKEILQQRYQGPGALVDFLRDVNQPGIGTLISEDRETYTYANKIFIYRIGQRPQAMYYVVAGKVKVSRSNDDGKDYITDIYGPGDYFGYTSILEEVNYEDEAQALEETKLMAIPAEDFLQLIRGDNKVALQFIKIITQNIASKEQSLLNLAYSSLRKKVAVGLVDLQKKFKGTQSSPVILNLSRENMAKSFGIATESLIRTLSDFKEEKLIAIIAGKVTVLDEKKLLLLH